MTIWILTLVLFIFCALLGHKQGAIRASISFFGILISGLFAWPLSGLVARLAGKVYHHPLQVWLVSPIVAFVILLTIFKWIGFFAHRRVRVFYQYTRDETRRLWWERLNRRVGMGVGLMNAFLYLVLISVPIYNFSYWTLQVASSDQDKGMYKLLNRMGGDLQSTGLSKVACAIDPMPKKYFQTADLAGLIWQNPEVAARLAAYPPFLPLAERDDIKQFVQSSALVSTWQAHGAISQIGDDSALQTFLQNQDAVNTVWGLAQDNLADLTGYLRTGQSSKYGAEPILGRWDIDVMASLHQETRTRANVPSSEMAELRALWKTAYGSTVLVAASDNEVFLKSFPVFMSQTNQPPTYSTFDLQGTWQSDDTYHLTFSGNGMNRSATATVEDSQLTMNMGRDRLILRRETE
ncbi:MAG: CvpA family protein [Limisphaerales bacterium]